MWRTLIVFGSWIGLNAVFAVLYYTHIFDEGIMALIALARILAAAHYLSDVSWGATIVLTLLVIANEVVARVKVLHPEEEVPAQE